MPIELSGLLAIHKSVNCALPQLQSLRFVGAEHLAVRRHLDERHLIEFIHLVHMILGEAKQQELAAAIDVDCLKFPCLQVRLHVVVQREVAYALEHRADLVSGVERTRLELSN